MPWTGTTMLHVSHYKGRKLHCSLIETRNSVLDKESNKENRLKRGEGLGNINVRVAYILYDSGP